MPDVHSPENIYLVFAFIVPGLVTVFIRSKFVTGRSGSQSDSILSYLALSSVYYAFVLPFGAAGVLLARSYSVQWEVSWVAIVLVGPAVFGVLLGLDARSGFLRYLLSHVGLNPVHVIPTAWDWKFGRMPPQFVLVTLTDGTRFAGFVSQPHSFMSSDPAERDIHIGRTYRLDESDQWVHTPGREVLIAAGSIQSVEFFPDRKPEGAE
jgi:hypothetical protein